MAERYAAAALKAFARALLEKAGMEAQKAGDVALILVEGDLLGHDTHGLALLAPYLGEVESGAMAKSGQPEVVSHRGATETWDGKRLPGPWLTIRLTLPGRVREANQHADIAGSRVIWALSESGFLATPATVFRVRFRRATSPGSSP